MRNEHSLSGVWAFQLDPEGTLTVSSLKPDRKIQVPMPWQAAFPELQKYSGFGWYQRSFDLEEGWLDGEVLLSFGAVDYWCQVFVNGKLAGGHEGGYTPVILPIREFLHSGRNEVAVRVYDTVQSEIKIARWPDYSPKPGSKEPPFDANEVPHGKQEWYINVGGIWQDVSITAVAKMYVEEIAVRPDIGIGEAVVRVRLGGEISGEWKGDLRVEVKGADGETAEVTVEAADGKCEYEVKVAVEKARLWGPDDPYLYSATVTISTSRGEDTVRTRFGFREIKTGNGQLLLNGEPIFLLAALDQDLYPSTIYTVPSDEFLRDGFRKAKELGFNCLRCHIKPPDPRYLDLADEMGLLVWAEIPSWRTFAQKGTVHANQLDLGQDAKERVAQTLVEMVRRDFNHPSLVIWTIVNEDWGTSLPLNSEDRAWVAEMYDYCKQLDPTRLVVDNSACPHPWGPNIHVKSDIDDFHVYANIPEGAASFSETIEQFGLRPLWTYSTNGDAKRTGKEPLILSEFGNWGLPSLKNLRDKEGRDPRWFDIGPWWSPWEGESGWPGGVEERFQKLGLDAVWRDYEEFAIATQWHQFAAMKFEIEVLRKQPAVEGYVITEFTDAYWESNGVLDFERNPKAYHSVFGEINAPNMIVPNAERYAYWDDQKLVIRPNVVRYTRGEWPGGKLLWNTDNGSTSGECRVPKLARGVVEEVASQSVVLPQVESAQEVTLSLRLESDAGEDLARNSVELLVLPASAREPASVGMVAVITRHRPGPAPAPDAAPLGDSPAPFGELQSGMPNPTVTEERVEIGLQSTLSALGYSTSSTLTAETKVAVSNFPNAELLHWVREGGDLLFISKGASPFFWVQNRGGVYGGNWITSFSWIRPEIHKRLRAKNPIGLPFTRAIPGSTILGLPFEDAAVQADFLAGAVSGWVKHPSVHTVQFRYGKGRVIMTTFALEDNALHDPASTAMLHDLLDHLCSDACRPQLAASY